MFAMWLLVAVVSGAVVSVGLGVSRRIDALPRA